MNAFSHLRTRADVRILPYFLMFGVGRSSVRPFVAGPGRHHRTAMKNFITHADPLTSVVYAFAAALISIRSLAKMRTLRIRVRVYTSAVAQRTYTYSTYKFRYWALDLCW